jgi:hypothetical protein
MKKVIFVVSFFIISADVSANTKYHYGLHISQSDYERLIGDYAFGANVGARIGLSDSPLFLGVDISPRLERFHKWDEVDYEYELLGLDQVYLDFPIRFLVGAELSNVSLAFFAGIDAGLFKDLYRGRKANYNTRGGLILGPSLSIDSGNGIRLEVAASYGVRGLFFFDDGINAWPWDDLYEFTWPWDDRSYSEIWLNLVMVR